jgi:hypothetical protein
LARVVASRLLVCDNTLNLPELLSAHSIPWLATLNPEFPGGPPSTLIRRLIRIAVRYET